MSISREELEARVGKPNAEGRYMHPDDGEHDRSFVELAIRSNGVVTGYLTPFWKGRQFGLDLEDMTDLEAFMTLFGWPRADSDKSDTKCDVQEAGR